MLNVDKGTTHVDNRWKKLKKPSVQQIQNAGLRPTFLLSSTRLASQILNARPASLYQNAKPAFLSKNVRPASLYQNAELMRPASL